MTLPTMYPGIVNSPYATLAASIDTDDTVIAVSELSYFPSGPNIATIGNDDEENPETIKYTSTSAASGAGNLTGVERAFQGTAQSWDSGTYIRRTFTEYDYDALCDNIVGHDHTGGASGTQLTEAALSFSDVTTVNASTAMHGLCPKLSGASSEFLDGTGAFTVPDTYTEIFEEDTGTLTLPSSPTQGQVYEIVGTGTAWTVNVPASTYVRLLDVLVSTSVAGSTGYECATFIYGGTIDSKATWIIKSVVGELTLT